ncbi:MAG TPA: CRTAC1 family protein [Pyrinomonadaceae bacterium]|nr:CRTAC1 family protein [Pyrinomonadaceae bacterium]
MTQSSFLQHYLTRLVAIALMIVAYGFARQPVLSSAERTSLAERFQFSRQALPDVAPEWPGHAPRQIRNVHPKLQKIAAWISAVGAAAALGDVDGNGLPDDVCYVDTRKDMVIVGPVPGTGARYAARSLNPSPLPYEPATMAPMGCLPGDLNEDGKLDLLVYYWGRTPVAFLRHGPGYVPRELVPGAKRWFTNAATLADLDGDGHIDVVIGNYFPDGARILDADATSDQGMQASMSHALNGGNKHLLLWQSSTKGDDPSIEFADYPNVFPDQVNHGWTLAAGAADLDGDLLPELYFANDFGPDRLLHNRSTPGKLSFDLLQGAKTFTTPHSSVVGRDSFKGMGVDFADLNGDGLPDIFVSNITTEYGLLESNFLYLSTGHVETMQHNLAPYVNRSEQLGLSRSGWGWDAKLADFDNDGVFEAIQAVGFLKGETNRWPELQELATSNDRLVPDARSWPQFKPGDDLSGHQHNPFFVRARDGRYYDLSPEVGLDEPQVSRGVAIADVDDDGGLDLVFANQWGPSYFYRNTSTTRGAFLNLNLLLPLEAGNPSQTWTKPGPPNEYIAGRAAIGATVTVVLPDGKRMVAQVDGGNGHSGKRSPGLHFGLGAATGPVRVEVHWRDPDGQPNSETLTLKPGSHTVVLGWKVKGGSR